MILVKPDYIHWVKQDLWTLEQAAFLIRGLDPSHNDVNALHASPVPDEFKTVFSTYRMLEKVPRTFLNQEKGLIQPVTAVTVAIENEVPVEDLVEAVLQASDPIFTLKPDYYDVDLAKNPLQLLATRERRNLLKALGIVVQLHFTTPRYQRAGKINAVQVTQAIIEKAQSLGMEIDGLKSLDRKITTALALIEEEIAS